MKAVFLLTLLWASPASLAIAQETAGPPVTVDINGLRLGMTPAEATAAIGAAGLPNVHRGGKDFYIDKVRLNNRDDLIFTSAMRSEVFGDPSPFTGGERLGRRIMAVSFLPDTNRERAWGIYHYRTFRPGEGPLVANTIEGLVDKYGEPNLHKGLAKANFIRGVPASEGTSGGTMLWYWNDAGKPMDTRVGENCRAALSNSMIGSGGPDIGLYNGVTLDSSMTKRDWEAGRRAGCGRVIEAQLGWNRDGVLTRMSVSAVDLGPAWDAAVNLSRKIQGHEAEAQRERVRKANENKPEL
ncbi:hypothetical protein [Allosphingosinicella vermicomposti]|uniref:hypothetical protein n=1 Tax=Allosphingosinicella vermicomposti TaxID=614671 RepID=UPI000D113E05|nr:hypothetical protein [Allosphingosinicella vermicomposti]